MVNVWVNDVVNERASCLSFNGVDTSYSWVQREKQKLILLYSE